MEISASGYTKELQQDDQLLHPVGPEGEENLSEDEQDSPEVPASASEDAIDMEEYKHAILELEGLKIGNEASSGEKSTEEQHDSDTSSEKEISPECTNDLVTDSSRRLKSDEELEENDDECPDLVDLSAYNKDFKPFR